MSFQQVNLVTPQREAQPHDLTYADGKAQPFRTSGGEAEYKGYAFPSESKDLR